MALLDHNELRYVTVSYVFFCVNSVFWLRNYCNALPLQSDPYSHKRHPIYLAREGELWGVFGEFIVWSMSHLCATLCDTSCYYNNWTEKLGTRTGTIKNKLNIALWGDWLYFHCTTSYVTVTQYINNASPPLLLIKNDPYRSTSLQRAWWRSRSSIKRPFYGRNSSLVSSPQIECGERTCRKRHSVVKNSINTFKYD